MFRPFCLALLCALTLAVPLKADGPSAQSPTGDRLARADDKTITVSDTKSNKILMKILAAREPITSLAYAPDGKILASADKGGDIRLFDTATGKELRRAGFGVAISKIAFSPDGKNLKITDAAKVESSLDVATGKISK